MAAGQRTPIRRWRLFIALSVACGMPTLASAQAYPNGASTTGTIVQTTTFSGVSTGTGLLLFFAVSGTLDDGSTGIQSFFIQDSGSEGNVRIANILAAATAHQTVIIWNYGQTYSYGGQTGYLSSVESAKF